MKIAETTCATCGRLLDPSRSRGRCGVCLFTEALDLPSDNAPLGMLGNYALLAEIARGGMGVVYRARESEPRRIVALKTLRSTELDSPETLVRFEHEAHAMAELDHPGILPVFAFGEDEGVPFFTMKLASGGTLSQRRDVYKGRGRAIAELMETVCEAVHHAHQRGVLHRDLKPANILFDDNGRAYVSDFGLAKLASTPSDLTRTVALLGTPHYLAPEVASHDTRAATTASDVWALGAVLYELLAQRVPFEADSLPALLRRIVDEDPPAFDRTVPRDLGLIARKALAKEPSRRYGSARDLADDLRRWLDGRPIAARPMRRTERVIAWAKRNPMLALLTGLCVLSIIVAFAGLAWGLRSARRQTREVEAARSEMQKELRGALLARAKAGRDGRILGWRDPGLQALREAAAIQPGDDLRDEAIAHLAGFDMIPVPGPSVPGFAGVADTFDEYVAFADDGQTTLHRVSDGLKIADLPAIPNKERKRPQFDRSGRWLGINSHPRGSWLFDRQSRTLRGSWPGGVHFNGFNDDGSLLVLHETTKLPRVIQTVDLKNVARLPEGARGVSYSSTVIANDPAVTAVATSGPEGVTIWDWRTGQKRRFMPLAQPWYLSWYGDRLLAGERPGPVRLFNLRQGTSVQLFGHTREVRAFTWTPDSTLCTTTSNDGSSALWHTDSGQLLARTRAIHPSGFSSDGTRFLYAKPQDKGHGWGELQCPTVLRLIADPTAGSSGGLRVDVSPDGRWLCLCGRRELYLFELRTGRLALVHPLFDGRSALFSADASQLVVCRTKSITVFSLTFDRTELKLRFVRDLTPDGFGVWPPMSAARLDPARQWLCVTVVPNQILLAAPDLNAWTPLPSVKGPNYSVPSPHGRYVVSSITMDGDMLRIWDRDKPDEWRGLEPGNGHPSFSPDGRWLLEFLPNRVRIFATGSWVVVHEEPTDCYNPLPGRAGWSPGSDLIAMKKSEHAVCLLDTRTWQIIATLESPIEAPISDVLFGPDGRTLVVTREGGGVEIWDLSKLSQELATMGLSLNLPPPTPVIPTPAALAGPFKEARPPPLFAPELQGPPAPVPHQ